MASLTLEIKISIDASRVAGAAEAAENDTLSDAHYHEFGVRD
jgi:hypothetical protein